MCGLTDSRYKDTIPGLTNLPYFFHPDIAKEGSFSDGSAFGFVEAGFLPLRLAVWGERANPETSRSLPMCVIGS